MKSVFVHLKWRQSTWPSGFPQLLLTLCLEGSRRQARGVSEVGAFPGLFSEKAKEPGGSSFSKFGSAFYL